MIEISVIIPVYNSEQYLRNCIESLLHQSFKDFEAILIDDGSSDGSYDIIKEYADRDMRIKFFHQQNAGVSAARNLGIESSHGHYLTFLDSDDSISSNYLEQLLRYAKKYSPEIILSGIINMKNGIEKSRVELEEGLLSLQTEKTLIKFLETPLLTSPVSKLYSRKIIVNNNIQFDTTISFAEDKDFNLQYFQHIKNAYALSYCGYFYRYVDTSLSHKRYDYRYQMEHKHWRVKKKMFESLDDHGSLGQSYLVNQLFYLIYDEMADIANHSSSVSEMMKKWNRSVQYVDYDYLINHYNLLAQSFWMKYFLKHQLFGTIFCILKMRN